MSPDRTVVEELSTIVDSMSRCAEDWKDKRRETIKWIEGQFLPHGSGFDSGTKFCVEESSSEKLVFATSFHHMNENGFYDGWTEHTVTVKPSFTGLLIRVSGRDRNQIKDYIYETMDLALNEVCARMDPETRCYRYGWFFKGEWVDREDWWCKCGLRNNYNDDVCGKCDTSRKVGAR